MWRIRRAAACSSSLQRWWFVEKNVARCSPSLDNSINSTAAFGKRYFSSRALFPSGTGKNYTRGVSFTCRGLATRHDNASDLSESDEFEEPESGGGLKELEDEPEEAKDVEDEEEEEEDHDEIGEIAAGGDRSSSKPVAKAKSDRRLTLANNDKLEQELMARIFSLKRDDSVVETIDKWKEEGKEITIGMVVTIINRLKLSNRMSHAIEMIDWVVDEPDFKDFKLARSFQIEITARAKGIGAAEKLFEELPEEEKTRPVYNALLNRYVFLHNLKKAEALFEEMDKAGFVSQSPFALNLMMKLYKRKGDNAKFQEMLEKARESQVEPNIHTYNVMLDLKARAGDIEGMEKIFEEMKSNPAARPDATSYFALSRGYLKAGLTDKAELSLLRLEVGPYRRTKASFEHMMIGYGELGLLADVERMWQKCKNIPGDGFNSFIVFQKAVALAGEVSRAESMFKHMDKWKRSKTMDQKRHNNLLLAYYRKGMKEKAKELEKKMQEMDLSVTLSEAEKEAVKPGAKGGGRAAVAAAKKDREKEGLVGKKALDEAAESGDVKAAERAFEKCKQANAAKVAVWNKLLKAYVNAEVPAYGFLQRMKAEGVEPNAETQALLKKLQAEEAAA